MLRLPVHRVHAIQDARTDLISIGCTWCQHATASRHVGALILRVWSWGLYPASLGSPCSRRFLQRPFLQCRARQKYTTILFAPSNRIIRSPPPLERPALRPRFTYVHQILVRREHHLCSSHGSPILNWKIGYRHWATLHAPGAAALQCLVCIIVLYHRFREEEGVAGGAQRIAACRFDAIAFV